MILLTVQDRVDIMRGKKKFYPMSGELRDDKDQLITGGDNPTRGGGAQAGDPMQPGSGGPSPQ